MSSAFGEGLHFVVGADDGHFFADELLCVFAARGCCREGAGDFFAVHFDDEGLGILVEGLQLTFVCDGFAATGEGGATGEADECNDGEDAFHVVFVDVIRAAFFPQRFVRIERQNRALLQS